MALPFRRRPQIKLPVTTQRRRFARPRRLYENEFHFQNRRPRCYASARSLAALSEEEVVKIREFIDKSYKVEGDLRREVAQDIKRKIEIGAYQGMRHRRSLPVRGQRTHTNARTRKGPKKAIAGKKKIKAKK